ncbi:hypothetical protein ACFL50_05350 [Candidatus Latescibacterota bacterium]
MLKPVRFFLCATILFLSLSASAELNLQNNKQLRDLGADPDSIFNERFSYEHALNRIEYINSYLKSFRTLTEQYKDRFTSEELNGVGNTDWVMQNLGFHNNLKAVEGALRKQDYLLKQLEYELAQYKHTAGEITDDELVVKRTANKHAEAEFQTFWDSFNILD